MDDAIFGIGDVSKRGIALIEDASLRTKLMSTYESPTGLRAAAAAQSVFVRLTISKWPADTLCRFLAGWRLTHGTALYVSGLLIRILRTARQSGGASMTLLHQAAGEIGEIIPEDTGVDDVPHNELFERFANQIVGDDRWKLDRYVGTNCARFRCYVETQRLKSPIEEAILTTAASENWNTGEYTFFDSVVRPWMTGILGMPAEIAGDNVRYVAAHAGKTELGHFLHAISAWQLYCKASGIEASAEKAGCVFEGYLSHIADAFGELEGCFQN